MFKVFRIEVEKQLGKVIKIVRSDRGGEYLIHVPVGGPESIILINLTPPTAVAMPLQYSGSRVEHMDEFSSHK